MDVFTTIYRRLPAEKNGGQLLSVHPELIPYRKDYNFKTAVKSKRAISDQIEDIKAR